MPKIKKVNIKEEAERLLFEKAAKKVKYDKDIKKATDAKGKIVNEIFAAASELGVNNPGDKLNVSVPESDKSFEIALTSVKDAVIPNALAVLEDKLGDDLRDYVITERVLAPNAIESLILNEVISKEWAKDNLFKKGVPKRIIKEK
jgi:hypothetical protein